MKTALAILLASLIVGLAAYSFAPGKTVTVPILPPVTYENIHVVPPASALPGEAIKIHTSRCQNTGNDLSVEISIYFQSVDGKRLIPFVLATPTASGQYGPNFTGVIKPGCVDNDATFPIPLDLPAGQWKLRGQICYGGVAIDKKDCGGWSSDLFEVGANPG